MAERTELLMLELIERLLQDPTSTPRQKERARRTLLVIEESRK